MTAGQLVALGLVLPLLGFAFNRSIGPLRRELATVAGQAPETAAGEEPGHARAGRFDEPEQNPARRISPGSPVSDTIDKQ